MEPRPQYVYDMLRQLAADFETLSDPAKDDSLFLYEWEPPAWYNGGNNVRRTIPGVGCEQDLCIEYAAILKLAATMLKKSSKGKIR